MKTLSIPLLLGVLLATGPVVAQEDISKVNGSISADAGQRYGKLDTVNGGIRVGEGVETGSIDGSTSSVGKGGAIEKKHPIGSAKSGISSLFAQLEANKASLGLEYYSVSQATLDQVFLSIVSKHNVQEENYAAQHQPLKQSRWKRLIGNAGKPKDVVGQVALTS